MFKPFSLLAACVAFLAALAASAPARAVPGAGGEGQRVALVIGNSSYAHAPHVATAGNDADIVNTALRRAGFITSFEVDLNRAEMLAALRRFRDDAAGAEIALIYFAGLGAASGGVNWLLPVDADISAPADFARAAIDLETLLYAAGQAAQPVLLLDASRAPFARIGAGALDLSRVDPSHAYILSAAEAGAVAADGNGPNSAFAVVVADRLPTRGMPLSAFAGVVRADVQQLTGGRQSPALRAGAFDPRAALAGAPLATAAPSAPPSADGPSRGAGTRGITRTRDRVITGALAELLPNEERLPRNGGSAVVLLADPAARGAAQRNVILCRALFSTFDEATSAEIRRGARIGGEGELQLLRPIYWPSRVSAARTADPCAARLEVYDFPRRDRIVRKLGLAGAGPFLVVEQFSLSNSERVAAIIDLSRTSNGQLDDAVDYFRDGFLQADDIWRPDRYAPARANGLIAEFFGRRNADPGFLPQLVRAAGVAACPFTDLLDICRN